MLLPAFQAGKTLQMTYDAIPHEVVDEVLLVDDGSTDDTVEVAHQLGINTIVHSVNKGYGANQKTLRRHFAVACGCLIHCRQLNRIVWRSTVCC